MIVTCPHCHGRMATDGPQAVTCPHCLRVVPPVAAARVVRPPANPPRPTRRSRSRPADDEEDDAPRSKKPRRRSRTKSNAGLIVGGIAGGLLLLLVIGGLGVYLLGGAGGGRGIGLLPVRHEVTIFQGSRSEWPVGGVIVGVGYRVDRAPTPGAEYFTVVKAGGRTVDEQLIFDPVQGMTASGMVQSDALRGVPGPYQVWIERRAPGGKTGPTVSNVYNIP